MLSCEPFVSGEPPEPPLVSLFAAAAAPRALTASPVFPVAISGLCAGGLGAAPIAATATRALEAWEAICTGFELPLAGWSGALAKAALRICAGAAVPVVWAAMEATGTDETVKADVIVHPIVTKP